jgi:glyoxylase-like metal-dependent hydrolase (beta-lactamase superfamily II)
MTRLMPVSPTGIKVARTPADGETFMLGPHHVRVFAVPGHTQGSAAYLVDEVLFMGDAADTTSDGTVIGSPWVFSDSQPQDRASLVALADRLARENAQVKVIAFAHSGLLAGGLSPLAAYAGKNR